jgi:hypothetical protein
MPESVELETTTSTASRAEDALIDVGLVFLFLLLPHGLFGDATLRFDALRDPIERGTVSPMPYSFAQPLASAPFYLLGISDLLARVVVRALQHRLFCCRLIVVVNTPASMVGLVLMVIVHGVLDARRAGHHRDRQKGCQPKVSAFAPSRTPWPASMRSVPLWPGIFTRTPIPASI